MISSPERKSDAVLTACRQDDALILKSERGLVRLMPLCGGILRVTATREADFSRGCRDGFLPASRFAAWDFAEKPDGIELRTEKLTVRIWRRDGALTLYDAAGRLLLRENGRELEPFDALRPEVDEHTKTHEITTPDGVKKVVDNVTMVFDRRLYHTRQRWLLQKDEHLFGLGQSPDGRLNLRGATRYLHQANLRIAIPFFLSSEGYGVLSATGGVSVFRDDENGAALTADADPELDFYYLYGPEFDDIIAGYRFLTGKAPMLPKWAFGYIQSQERYETQAELLSTAKQFRRRGLGLDALVLDWCSWPEGQWGQKTPDPARFPDFPALVAGLAEQRVHLMVSIWPTMDPSTPDYAEFAAQNLLLPANTIYNALDENARRLYWQQTKRGLYGSGVRAFWCDNSEPLIPEWSGEMEPEPCTEHALYLETAEKFLPRDRVNCYSFWHAKAIWDGMRAEGDDARVCNLTRCAHTGAQRFGVVLWSGDTAASWQTLRRQIAAGLNFCASGFPYWTLDIGGFFIKKGVQWFWNGDYPQADADLGYRELYVRWFQFGAFLPMFRAHGTDARREPWAFGEPGTPFYEALRAAIRLRYCLMPTLYSEAAGVYFRDGTLLRMLAFDFRRDPAALDVRDEFMLGHSLLVCPVTEPLFYAAGSQPLSDVPQTRRVYLPQCEGWYDFYTGQRYAGGQWLDAPAPLDRIPLFVRAGSLLALARPAESTADAGGPFEIRVYPGRDAELELYDDAGDGCGYERGEYTLRRLHWDDARAELTSDGGTDGLCITGPC